jgi:dTDP-glucose pyrophosphorylase
MFDISKHILRDSSTVLEGMEKLNNIPHTLTLFVVNDKEQLVGTLTDGDIRRGFLKGLQLSDKVDSFITREFSYLNTSELRPSQIRQIKNRGVRLLPVIDETGKINRVIDFGKVKTILPVDAVLMAGGRGERLRPLTDKTPKPLLKIGEKPILEHNLDHLIFNGIQHYYITIRYLAEQIESYFGDGSSRGISIQYIKEEKPLGTLGSVSLIKEFKHRYILVMNSDLFTNIDFEDFYEDLIQENADMSVATVPYVVDVPYAVLNLDENKIRSFREKPTFTYYSNAGIYLIKKELLDNVPVDKNYNATDFIQALIDAGKKVIRYPIIGYWIDIGKPEDYQKVQEIAKHISYGN